MFVGRSGPARSSSRPNVNFGIRNLKCWSGRRTSRPTFPIQTRMMGKWVVWLCAYLFKTMVASPWFDFASINLINSIIGWCWLHAQKLAHNFHSWNDRSFLFAAVCGLHQARAIKYSNNEMNVRKFSCAVRCTSGALG